jgi:hypothetical protein
MANSTCWWFMWTTASIGSPNGEMLLVRWRKFKLGWFLLSAYFLVFLVSACVHLFVYGWIHAGYLPIVGALRWSLGPALLATISVPWSLIEQRTGRAGNMPLIVTGIACGLFCVVKAWAAYGSINLPVD